MTFFKDGKTLYGIRAEGDHQYLFSLTIATGQMTTIGDVGSEFAPRSYLIPGIRFSLSPDGQSILCTRQTALRRASGCWKASRSRSSVGKRSRPQRLNLRLSRLIRNVSFG